MSRAGLENLRLFRSLYRGQTRDPMELLRLVDLADDAGQRVGSYSKGMKMRLNLTVFWIVLGFRLGLRAFHRQVSWRQGAL